jgi:catechol 2,3-dioxygenase-like lactoylglutathione lyase family enzyme
MLTSELHLSHVALIVEDVERCARFYEDVLGMARHETLPDGSCRLGWGLGHHVVELSAGEPGLGHFGLEVPDDGALDGLAAALGATPHQPAGEHPPVRRLEDPDGNRIELHGRIDRSGERGGNGARRPVRVQHITLGSPQMAAMVAFYERLGFRVSDRMGDVFTWLRCDRAHHTVAIVRSSEPRLDHYSYDVDGWADFKTWCDELAARDVRVTWGPGRHGPGNNLFIMFSDPSGFRVELSAEMERFWDDRARHEPRDWTPAPETVNLWGPAPSWRNEVTATGAGA